MAGMDIIHLYLQTFFHTFFNTTTYLLLPLTASRTYSILYAYIRLYITQSLRNSLGFQWWCYLGQVDCSSGTYVYYKNEKPKIGCLTSSTTSTTGYIADLSLFFVVMDRKTEEHSCQPSGRYPPSKKKLSTISIRISVTFMISRTLHPPPSS